VFFFPYRKGGHFFGQRSTTVMVGWYTTPAASVEITVSGRHNRLNYSVIVYSLHIKVKVKVKFTLEQVTKAQRGSRGRTLLFL